MRDKRLLERLLETEDRDALRAQRRPEERLLISVIGHVEKLMNTRRGNAAIDPEYGLPDLSKLVGAAPAEQAAKVEALVAAVLARYEPRLKSAAVKLRGLSADGMALRLELTGSIEHAGSALPLRVLGEVLPDGRIELHP